MRIEHWFYALPLRLRSLFLRQQVEQDLEEELQYHLEQKIEEYRAKGLTPAQSRQAALRAMDGLTQRKEECRDVRGMNAVDNTLQDLRYSLRVLAKSPGFTAAAVVTLALAIGANAVVFGVLNGLILRPLNVPEAQGLFMIERERGNGYQSYPDYLDLRDRNRSFDGLAAYNIDQAGLDTGVNPSRVWVEEVSGNYFDVLRLQPYAGRFFHSWDEHGPNSAPYIVLTYAYWQNHFQGDRGVVGRTVQLNRHPFTILGVVPSGFHGTLLFFSPDFFVPMVNQPQVAGVNMLNARGNRSGIFAVLGHLKAGATPAQATANLNSIGSYLEKTYPKEDGHVTFGLAHPDLYGNFLGPPVRAFVTGLMLLSGLILLAACANLGSLFAARAADRSREVALRLALGAKRNRILRTLFTEALLISLAGGALGLWGSVALLRGLSAWQPVPRFPLNLPVSPDANVYGVALLLALVSGILFGMVPVRQVLPSNPYQIVKAGQSSTVGRRITVRDLVLVVQIAICAVLITSSMVAVRGLARSLHSNFGFAPRNAMLVDTDLGMAGHIAGTVPAMQRRMVGAAESLPGVASAGLIDQVPLYGDSRGALVFSADMADLRPSNAAANSFIYSISPNYLRAAGTAMLAGRTFSWHDDENSPRVAIVNREFARRIFGSVATGVGSYYKMQDGGRIQVVGVVEDGKYFTLTEDPQPAMFLPILQSPSSETWLVMRSNRDPHQLAAAIRSSLRDMDRGLPVFISTWDKELGFALFPSLMATVALGVLGGMGAMLSITGIFGMAAFSVSRRLKELGIRMAIGAQPREVLQAALGRSIKLLSFGSAAGLILGILASRVLASIVYQATPRDPLVLSGVVLVMALVGLLATWIPAQRALSIDPVKLLRED